MHAVLGPMSVVYVNRRLATPDNYHLLLFDNDPFCPISLSVRIGSKFSV